MFRTTLNRFNLLTLSFVAALFLMVACRQASGDSRPAATSTPEAMSLVTSVEEMVGVYWGKGSAFQSFDADGNLRVASTREKLVDETVAIGKYWFENGHMHLHQTEGTTCAGSVIGEYEIWRLSNGNLRFDAVADACINRVRSIEGERTGAMPTTVEWAFVSADVPQP